MQPDGPRDVVVTERGYGLGPPTGVLVLTYRCPVGAIELGEMRDDFRHQLFWAEDGWLAVRRGGRVAFAGPRQGVWVPAGLSAEIRSGTTHNIHAVHLRQSAGTAPDHHVCLVDLSDAARNAIARMAEGGMDDPTALGLREHLMAGVRPRSDVPYAGTGEGLAMQVISALMADPADDTDLAAWAERLHVSTRTLQRDFTRHVGSTWSAWRTQHRLEASVAMLDLYPVTTVAHLVGYATASAYVAAFRRYFGTTPGRALLTQPHVPDVARSA